MDANQKIKVMTASQSFTLLSALKSFLSTIPEVELLESQAAIYQVLEKLPQQQPHLLLLNVDLLPQCLPSDLAGFLLSLHGAHPGLKVIVFVDDFLQMQAVRSTPNAHALFKWELGLPLRSMIHVHSNPLPDSLEND